jgi:hypothetical protein
LTGTERLAAAPIVFFLNQPTAFPQQLITDVDVPFAIAIDTSGNFSRIFQNVTGLLITDFHFRSNAPEATVWQGGGGVPRRHFFKLPLPYPIPRASIFIKDRLAQVFSRGRSLRFQAVGLLSTAVQV